MARPDIIVIDGRAYSWRALVEARKAQLEARRKAQDAQPALFPLREDCPLGASAPPPGAFRSPRCSNGFAIRRPAPHRACREIIARRPGE